jgi:tripartite-type tricarboxylate transporter receptor subunit TctC
MIIIPRFRAPARRIKAVTVAIAALLLDFTNAAAQDHFYAGKQIKLVTHVGPSSGYAVWARLVAAHFGRRIPGAPSMIVQNMPGSGGLQATNYIYSQASKDGLELGALNRLVPTWSIMGYRGANFDAAQFGWLGSPASDTNLCIVSKRSPIQNLDELMSKEVVVGTDGVGSGMHIFPTALNSILGTKFKTIGGYKDTGDVILAVDRGEVHGLCLSAETLMNMRSESFTSGEWRPILQTGHTVSPDFPGVPLIFDRAKTTEQRQLLSFLFSSQAFGRPYLAPPGLPPERLAMLRQAFDETMSDPKFLADVAKARLKVSPTTGVEMDRMMKELKLIPKEIVAAVAKLIGSGGN